MSRKKRVWFRCSVKEAKDGAWRRCTRAPGHEGGCSFGYWSKSAEAACTRCGAQADQDELGRCAGCERDCCMACLEDGTCRSCLAEERSAEQSEGPRHTCKQAMAKIMKLCQDAEESWRYSDNEEMESRAQGVLDKLEKIGEIARKFLPE